VADCTSPRGRGSASLPAQKRTAEAAQLGFLMKAEYHEYNGTRRDSRDARSPGALSYTTSISPEYRAALSALHDKHQDMARTKFGHVIPALRIPRPRSAAPTNSICFAITGMKRTFAEQR